MEFIKYYYVTNPDGTVYKNGRGQYLTEEMAEEYIKKGYKLEYCGVCKEEN